MTKLRRLVFLLIGAVALALSVAMHATDSGDLILRLCAFVETFVGLACLGLALAPWSDVP